MKFYIERYEILKYMYQIVYKFIPFQFLLT